VRPPSSLVATRQSRGITYFIYRWVQKFTPQLEATFRNGKKRPVGKSWRMDETYIKINGQWRYLYRAVDKAGQTIDFLLTAHRDKKAALRFLKKAIRHHGLPEKGFCCISQGAAFPVSYGFDKFDAENPHD
jgi:transposase-like protein